MDENGPFIDKLPKIHPIMVNCCYVKLPEGSHGYRQNRRYTMELCLFPLMGNPLPGKSIDVYWGGGRSGSFANPRMYNYGNIIETCGCKGCDQPNNRCYLTLKDGRSYENTLGFRGTTIGIHH